MIKNYTKVLLIDNDESTNFYNSIILKRTTLFNEIEVATCAEEGLEILKNTLGSLFPCAATFFDIGLFVSK